MSLVVLVLIFQTACSEGQNNTGNILSPEQVSHELDKGGITLLDVRTPSEWDEGVIEGALLKNFYDDDFVSSLSTIDKAQTVIVTCKRGGRSAEAVVIMQKAGFKEVYDMEAGMDGWNEERRPTVQPE